MDSKKKTVYFSLGTFVAAFTALFEVLNGLQNAGITVPGAFSVAGVIIAILGSSNAAMVVAFVRTHSDFVREKNDLDREKARIEASKEAQRTGNQRILDFDLHSKILEYRGSKYTAVTSFLLALLEEAGKGEPPSIQGEQYIQDLAFLIMRETGNSTYVFAPSTFGPRADKLEYDLAQLRNQGLIKEENVQSEYGGSQKQYLLTKRGSAFINSVEGEIPHILLEAIKEVSSRANNYAAIDLELHQKHRDYFEHRIVTPNIKEIAIGSTNQAKVEGISNAVNDVWRRYEIRIPEIIAVRYPHLKTSRSEGEAIAVAIERARMALKNDEKADLGIGAEGYVMNIQTPNGNEVFLGGWVAIVQRGRERASLGCSSRVKIPSKVAQSVMSGEELEDAVAREYSLDMREHELRLSGGTNALLTSGYYTRVQEFKDATVCALAPIITEKYYKE